LPVRSAVNGGHAYISAPYGIFCTSDGYIALAMGNILTLAKLMQVDALNQFDRPEEWFSRRDEIKAVLVDHLQNQTTDHWLSILEPADIWCSRVLDYKMLMQEEAYQSIHMEIVVKTSNGIAVTTTRCPIRVDGELLVSERGAPKLGEHNAELENNLT